MQADNNAENPNPETVGHWINGELCFDNAPTQPVFNPATGQVIRQVVFAS